MNVGIAALLGFLLALAGTIYICVCVMPASKKDGLSPFFQKVHDIVNFRQLLVEYLLKIFYVLSTLLCVCCGFFLLFGKIPGWYSSHSTALYGVLLMILGPIICRISYECAMIFILILKNVMEINKHLGGSSGNAGFADIHLPAQPAPAAPAESAAPLEPLRPVTPPAPPADDAQ
ncbi:MAG: hypothetical protein IK141_04505 [Clostridia bacterium]|nr:hypothetical protein [Clostridia bacterium]